ncbi:MAG: hypothetical protein IJY61_08580 [Candidatus Gastranaerophilales bacterium]|nr:hypothetical protein [Candidatus Gastranaerophilales bacterium]
MYKFSVPMPFETRFIDDLVEINKEVEKSKISEVYFSLPNNCSDNSGFEQLRTTNHIKTNYSDWEHLFEYTQKNDLELVYLLNTPKPFFSESNLLDKQLEKLDKLLKKLQKSGCNKLRITNIQLMEYIRIKYPKFKINVSTSLEYTEINQYINFLKIQPYIESIVPSYNVNRNFKLLKNLKSLYPNLEIELMVNEGCIFGCPLRYQHNLSLPYIQTETYLKRDNKLTAEFFNSTCKKYSYSNLLDEICKATIIYPWDIESYSDIGINKFKLVGRNCPEFSNGNYLKIYKMYLKGIDDPNYIKDEEFRFLNHYIMSRKEIKIKIKEIKPYLPKISHFIENGHFCSSVCGVECVYCYDCAKKIKELL